MRPSVSQRCWQLPAVPVAVKPPCSALGSLCRSAEPNRGSRHLLGVRQKPRGGFCGVWALR